MASTHTISTQDDQVLFHIITPLALAEDVVPALAGPGTEGFSAAWAQASLLEFLETRLWIPDASFGLRLGIELHGGEQSSASDHATIAANAWQHAGYSLSQPAAQSQWTAVVSNQTI